MYESTYMCMNDGEKGGTRIGRDVENRARYEVASEKAACKNNGRWAKRKGVDCLRLLLFYLWALGFWDVYEVLGMQALCIVLFTVNGSH
jgi:hypothetical protein